jgi:hypothetical protein
LFALFAHPQSDSSFHSYAAMSPHGETLFVRGDRQSLAAFSIDDEAEAPLRWSRRFPTLFHSIAVSPTGHRVAVDLDGSTGPSDVMLLDPDNGETRFLLKGAMDSCRMQFSDDGKFLYGTSWAIILKWNANNGRRVFRRILGDPDEDNIVNLFNGFASFVPGSSFTRVSLSVEEVTSLWSANGKKLVANLSPDTIVGEQGGKLYSLIRNDPDQAPSYVSSLDGTGESYEIPGSSALIREFDSLSATSYRGMTFAGRSPDKKDLLVFNVKDGSLINRIRNSTGVWNQDSHLLTQHTVVSSLDGGVEITHVRSGKNVVSILFDTNEGSRSWVVYLDSGQFWASEATKRDEPGTKLLPDGRTWNSDPVAVRKAFASLWPQRATPVKA